MTALDRLKANSRFNHLLSAVTSGLAVAAVAAVSFSAPAASATSFDGDTPNSHFLQHTAERVANQMASMQKIDSVISTHPRFRDPRIPGPEKAAELVNEMKAVLDKAPNDEIAEMDNTFMRLPDSVAPNSQVSLVATALNVEKRYLFKATSLVEIVADGYRSGDMRLVKAATHDLDELMREFRVGDKGVQGVIRNGIASIRAGEPDIAPEPPTAVSAPAY